MSLSLSLHALDEADARLLDEVTGWLEPTERARAERFATDTLRRRFLAAQAALRQHLASRLGIASGQLRLCRDAHGKPHLPPPAPLHFSLSHSGGWALVAVAEVELGVDIEALIAKPGEGLAAQFLAPAVLADWRAQADAERSASLTLAWCAREAVLKLDGRGLALDPRSIDLPLVLPAAARWEGGQRSARVVQLEAPPGYRACLASGDGLPVPAIAWRASDAGAGGGMAHGRKSGGSTTM